MQRRDFAAAATLTAAGYRRASGANDRIKVGIIGLGNNGIGQHVRGLLTLKDKVDIVAVCDIYKPRLDRGLSMTTAKGYHDYHDLLADKSIDAVVISTPDHWHARMAIDAMRAGKDVDVEKPMAITIEEAQEMVRVSKETGRVLAVDSEHMVHDLWRYAKVAVDSGVLGKLLWSQTSRSRNSREPAWEYEIDGDASPRNLDWDRWLGSTAKVPFSKERFFRWRRFWEYGGGITTDLYYHHITPLIHITGRAFPVRGTASGGHYVHPPEVIEVPDTFLMTLDFANHHTMFVGGSLANSLELPIAIRGNEANIVFSGGAQTRPASLFIEPEGPYAAGFREKIRKAGLEGTWVTQQPKGRGTPFRQLSRSRQEEMIAAALGEAEVKADYDAAARKNPALQSNPATRLEYFAGVFEARAASESGRTLFRIDSKPGESFDENFLRCIRTREKPVLDGDLGYRSLVAVVLGVEAYRKNKVTFFDPKLEKMVDQPRA
jgi:predicted dehydrogenase